MRQPTLQLDVRRREPARDAPVVRSLDLRQPGQRAAPSRRAQSIVSRGGHTVKLLSILAMVLSAGLACSGPGTAPSPSPQHGRTVTIQTGVNPAGIAVGNGFAWVANSGEGTVWKVGLASDKVVGKISVGGPRRARGLRIAQRSPDP